MTYRTNTWGWKGIAARLLLAPVVAGGIARAAQAQPPAATPTWTQAGAASAARAAAPSGKVTSTDPKELMKLGRQALAAGRLDQAQDYASQANQAAAAKAYKWGLFDDAPTSLMKDVQDARAAADRKQSEDLFAKAKALFAKPAANEVERMAALDQAMNMAYQAKNLHGGYSVWDFGDKPDKLISDIEAAKAQLRKKLPAATMPATVAKAPAVPGIQQVGATMPATQPGTITTAGMTIPMPNMAPAATATISVSPAKAEVLKIVIDGRVLLSADKVLEARDKADTARALAEKNGLTNSFGAMEESPEKLFKDVQAKGRDMIAALVGDADKQVAARSFDKADAALDMARKLSSGLGLYTKPIDDRKTAIAKLMPAKPAAAVAVASAIPNMPAEYLVPVEPVAAPPQPLTVVQNVPTPPMPAANPMLTQAAAEMKLGNLDMAHAIAINVHNNGDAVAKAEAQSLLRQIDAEEAAKKRTDAKMAFDNAVAAFNAKQYDTAQTVLKLIDPVYLTPEQKTTCDKVMTECAAAKAPVRTVGGTDDDLKAGLNRLDSKMAGEKPAPMTAVADEQKAMGEVAFQKLRTDSLEAMTAAGAAWGRGETDLAMKALDDGIAKVKGSSQSPARQAMLIRPMETRLEGYARLKHNTDVLAGEMKDKATHRKDVLTDHIAEAQLQDEIKKKVREVSALQKAGKYKEAETLALQTKGLDQDNPTLTAVYEMSRNRRRMEEAKAGKNSREGMTYEGLQEADREGAYASIDNPIVVDPRRSLLASQRGDISDLRVRTTEELKIEQKLSASYPIMKFDNMPLTDVLREIRTKSGLNIVIDDPALEDEKISLDAVTIKDFELKDVSLKTVLSALLGKARLVHIVEDDVIKVTTEKRSKGRMKTKVFHVMDLVTPIPEYKLSPHHTLSGAIAASKELPPAIAGMGGNGPTPRPMANGLGGGTLATQPAGSGTPFLSSGTGSLQSSIGGGSTSDGPVAMSPQRAQYSEQLRRLICGMVRPYSWQDNGTGGAGSIFYYDIGGAMVVNQTADVIGEVEALLNSLRKLQDLSVAVEIRVISLSEAFFERIGVDFQANITTKNTSFERSLATSSFRPEPFLNDISAKGTTVGYSPATGFSSDLNVPVRATSYGLTAPPFGGYQGALSPTSNGGLSLGLAFLNDIQVYLFLEAAQGNRRVNIMQAPKITLFNGQTSTVFVGDLAYFTTSLQVFNVGGQFVYLPVNQSFPIGNGQDPNGVGTQQGVSVTVQAVVSADRRFVRLNLTPQLTALASATVPLFPITTFITPVFEGGSQGQPIPFTQYFQQPSFTEISAQTTVAVPDGGTVLLGGLKTSAQGRNEFGPPVLSQIPYLNRLFKNVGVGSETRHIMLMVTPRIIINSEEELRQVGTGTE